jgi:hypothetical protein
MSFIRAFLASESNARSIGANSDGSKNADYVFVNPDNGMVLVKEEGQKAWMSTIGNITQYKVAFFDESFIEDLIDAEKAKVESVVQASEAEPEIKEKPVKVKKKR